MSVYAQCLSASAFDNTVGVHLAGTTTHQVHDNVEDAFIDEMAMGHLLCKDLGGTLLAGTVEGLVAELLQVRDGLRGHGVRCGGE